MSTPLILLPAPKTIRHHDGHYSPRKEFEGVTRAKYDAAETRIDAALRSFCNSRMGRADAGLVADEFRNAAAMPRHACRRVGGGWMRTARIGGRWRRT